MLDRLMTFFMEHGAWGLFLHSALDAIIFPIPAFFLQVPLSLADPKNALILATFGFIGSLIGTPIGYYLGYFFGKPLVNKILPQKWVDKATELYNTKGETAILIGAFTPIPFKVFTILSGVFRFSIKRLMLFAAIGRFVKFYVVGAAFYFLGPLAKPFIDEYSHYIFLGVAILIGIFLFLKKRKKKVK